MKRKLIFICIICFSYVSIGLAQEDSIYEALDTFLANPSPTAVNQLSQHVQTLETLNKESHLARVITDCNIGYYQSKYGYLQAAIEAYESAWQRYHKEQLSNYDMISQALIPLGNLYTQTNAFTEAENTIRTYITLSRKQKNTETLFSGLINLSIPLQNQGKFSQAIVVLEEALKIKPDHPDALMNLASAYFGSGDFENAKSTTSYIIRKTPKQINALKLRAQIALQEQDTPSALAYLEPALRYQLENPATTKRMLTKTRLALAQTLLINQHIEASQEQLYEIYKLWISPYNATEVLPQKEQLIAENSLIDAFDIQAEIFKRNDKKTEALKAYTLASEIIDLLDTPELLQQSKLALQAGDKLRNEQSLQILFELYENDKSTSWFMQALQLSDRSKASITNEAVQNKKLLAQYTDDLIVKEYNQNRTMLYQLENQIWATKNQSNINFALIESLQSQYTEVLLTQRKLRDQIQKTYPTLTQDDLLLSLDRLQEKARKNKEIIISYFWGKTNIYQFIITENEIQFNQLTQDLSATQNFKDLCISYIHLFNNASEIINTPDIFIQQSHELYQLLQIPKTKNLAIIPDGFLSFIPFNSLLTETHSGYRFDKMPFLLKTSLITHQTSLASYSKEQKERVKDPSIVGAFPVFENSDRELSYSIDEATAISNTFKTKVLLQNKAKATTILEWLTDKTYASTIDILHLSTHASGGTFTAPAQLEFIDKTITVNDLYGLDTQLDLVVLSACETGIGPIAQGEGVLSLARGFQYAGTPNLLFSLWKVNDKATSQLMGNFYTSLKKTNSKTHSLHQAQLDYLMNEAIPNEKKSPYYWSAFVFYGNYESVETSTSWQLLTIFGLFGLFLTYIVLKKYGLTSRISS